MRINLDIQDQNLTPEARATLVGILHRLELDPEKFTNLASLLDPEEKPLAPGELAESLRIARSQRVSHEPITPQEFFESMRRTKGFASKEEAQNHVDELRSEWD